MGKCFVLGVLLCLFQAKQTGSIAGVLRQRDGQPLSGIELNLYRIDGGRVEAAGTSTSDERGLYRFPDLVAGEYCVEFRDGACALATFYWRWKLDAATSNRPTSREAERYELMRLEEAVAPLLTGHPGRVRVIPGGTSLCMLPVPGRVDVSLVVTSEGSPVVGAPISLNALRTVGLVTPEERYDVPEGVTDGDGRIAFRDVREGLYVPQVEHASWEIRFAAVSIGGGEGAVDIPLALSPFRIRLSLPYPYPPWPLEACAPTLLAAPSVRRIGDSLARREWTQLGETVSCEIPYVPAGEYQVSAGVWESRTPVLVGPGSPHPCVTLVHSRYGTLHVEVCDASGSPCEGVRVIANSSGHGNTFELTTDRRGRATINLPPGTWRIGIRARAGDGFEGEPTEVEIDSVSDCGVLLQLATGEQGSGD